MNQTLINLNRPFRVNWVFPSDQPLLEGIRSKSLRKFFAEYPIHLTSANVNLEERPITTLEDFEEWCIFYQKNMIQKRFDVIANPQWYQKQIDAGFTLYGMWFYQNEVLVGSALYRTKEKEVSILSFKSSIDVNLGNKKNASLGSLIDYIYLEKMRADGFKKITSGVSRNSFGVTNTLGYLEFKLKMGYMPEIPETLAAEDWHQDVPVNDQGQVLFFASPSNQQKSDLNLYVIEPPGNPVTQITSIEKYAPVPIVMYTEEA